MEHADWMNSARKNDSLLLSLSQRLLWWHSYAKGVKEEGTLKIPLFISCSFCSKGMPKEEILGSTDIDTDVLHY